MQLLLAVTLISFYLYCAFYQTPCNKGAYIFYTVKRWVVFGYKCVLKFYGMKFNYDVTVFVTSSL